MSKFPTTAQAKISVVPCLEGGTIINEGVTSYQWPILPIGTTFKLEHNLYKVVRYEAIQNHGGFLTAGSVGMILHPVPPKDHDQCLKHSQIMENLKTALEENKKGYQDTTHELADNLLKAALKSAVIDKWTMEEAKALFVKHDLTHPVWDLGESEDRF